MHVSSDAVSFPRFSRGLRCTCGACSHSADTSSCDQLFLEDSSHYELLPAHRFPKAYPSSIHIMDSGQTDDASTEDLLFESARWLKPSTELNRTTCQAPGPSFFTKVWETFRELPKPLSLSEANPRPKEPPQNSEEWDRMWSNTDFDSFFHNYQYNRRPPKERWQVIQARPMLNLEELVSRSYVPGFEDGPEPLLTWRKGRDCIPGNTTYPAPAPEYYAYAALPDTDEIRILDLLPGQGSEPLSFNLHSGHLDDPATKYEALSYAWGIKMVDIINGGHRFSFPHSLYRALLRLRDSTQIRSVWADAICINQRDDQEKGHQVRKMRRIFKQAHRVLICLSEDDSHVAQIAFELAGRIHQGRFQDVPPPQSAIWGVLIRLFDKTWFNRIWCLQEVVLASSAQVIWGPATAPWEHIGFSAGWLCNTVGDEVLSIWLVKMRRCGDTNAYSETAYHPGVYRANLTYSLWLAYNTEASLAKRISFYELLCQTRPFQSTDPRDKVFSLIGIPTVDADPDRDQCFFEPDYSKTTEEIFVEVAKRISVRTPASLGLLGAVQRDHYWRSTSLPTWVPDWTVFRSRSLVPMDGPEKTLQPSSRPVRFDGLALLVSGVMVDTVIYNNTLFSRDWMTGMYSSLSEAWEEIIKRFHAYPGAIDLSEAFCWTITGGNNWLGQRLTATDRTQHIADYEAFRNQHCGDYKFPALEAHQETTQKVEPDAHRYFESLCHACSNRNFFITEKGYMGIGPGSMAKGTEIWLLSGAELPMTLKRCPPQSPNSGLHNGTINNTALHPDDTGSSELTMAIADTDNLEGTEASFEVVGESYVHGIMDGLSESNGSNYKDIRLV